MSKAHPPNSPLAPTHLPQRAVLRVGGPDCASFLDGLVSNRVALGAAPVYAALLTPQGKVMFDLLIFASTDALYLDCDADRADQLLQRLMLYKLRADVAIDDQRGALAVVAGDFDGDTAAMGPDPRHPAMGQRAIVAQDAASSLDGSLDAYHALRLSLGIPEGEGFAFEKDFWLETDAERLNGVAFDKGCYVGQELTARMKHRTNLKKKLMAFSYTGPAPEAGADIVNADGKAAGQVREATDGKGMALLRLNEAQQGALAAGETVLTPLWQE